MDRRHQTAVTVAGVRHVTGVTVDRRQQTGETAAPGRQQTAVTAARLPGVARDLWNDSLLPW